eukprot:1227874-Amphidinium_carterae.1
MLHCKGRPRERMPCIAGVLWRGVATIAFRCSSGHAYLEEGKHEKENPSNDKRLHLAQKRVSDRLSA